MTTREFDIVLWGATGATGRRAAHHLARRCGERRLRLAIGGRNQEKLEALREAQLWMLRAPTKTDSAAARGLTALDKKQSPDKNGRLPPYYWAAFVLSGDWR